MRKSKRGGAFYFLALVVIESRAGAAAAKVLLGEASLLGVHAALARRREPVRRGRGAARRRPGPAAVRRRGCRRGPALRSRPYSYASCRRACARRRGRGRGAGAARRRSARPSGAPSLRGSLTARRWRGAGPGRAARGPTRGGSSRAGAGGTMSTSRSSGGLPIVLKACDKQHAEDERHNEAPARASREECTTDGLRE